MMTRWRGSQFEGYRSKDAQRDVLEEEEVLKIKDASEVEYQKDEGRVHADDLWQEHFREFTDNKRRGPTSVAMDVKFYEASQLTDFQSGPVKTTQGQMATA
jgi:hypothetical protein